MCALVLYACSVGFGFFSCVDSVFYCPVIAKSVVQFFALLYFENFQPVFVCVHTIVFYLVGGWLVFFCVLTLDLYILACLISPSGFVLCLIAFWGVKVNCSIVMFCVVCRLCLVPLPRSGQLDFTGDSFFSVLQRFVLV